MYKFTWCLVPKYFNLTTSYEGLSPKHLELFKEEEEEETFIDLYRSG